MEATPSFQAYVSDIVPKGDKYGAWRYDVKNAAKTIVIFKLDPDSIVPVVTQSICLQYLIRPADLKNAVLYPKITSGGVEVGASFLISVIGCSVVKSADDVRQILDFLDAGDKQDTPEQAQGPPNDAEGILDEYLIVSPPSPEIALPTSVTSGGKRNGGFQSTESITKKCSLADSNLCGMVAHVCPDRLTTASAKRSLSSTSGSSKTSHVPTPRRERIPKVPAHALPALKGGSCPLEASKLCGLIPHACPKKPQPVSSSLTRNLLNPGRSPVPSVARTSQSGSRPSCGTNVMNPTCPLAASKLCGIVAHKCPDAKRPSSSSITPSRTGNDSIARLLATIGGSSSKGSAEPILVAKRKPVTAEENHVAKKAKVHETTSTPVKVKRVEGKGKIGLKTSKSRRAVEDNDEDSDFEVAEKPAVTPRRSSARIAVRASKTPQTNISEDEEASAVESNPDDTEDDATFEPEKVDDDRATSDEDTPTLGNTEPAAARDEGFLQQQLQQTSKDTISSLLQAPSANHASNEHNFMPAANTQSSEPSSAAGEGTETNNTETVSKTKTAAELSNKDTILTTSPSVMKVHPQCGGTILSSQYWATPGPDKVKLVASQPIYVDSEAMKALTEHFSKNDTGKNMDQMSRCIKYGWTVIEHLLGGTESIATSLSACSDSTSSFNTEMTSNVVNTVCQAATEHVGAVFFPRNGDCFDKKLFQTEIRRRLFHSASYSTRASWRPCAPQVRDALRLYSKPAPDKIQLTYGFDYYVNADKLAELKHRCLDEYDGSEEMETVAMRYAVDVMEALLGDLLKLKEACIAKFGGAIGIGKLVGHALQHAVHCHTKQTFCLGDTFDLTDFKRRITSRLRWRTEKANTSLLASVVFSDKAEADARYDNGPPARPGCNYWNAPAPNLTRLSEKHNVYMKTLRLAEYQRYYGPESLRQGQFMRYITSVVMHALGGEPAVYRKISDMLVKKPAYGEIVPKELLQAICVHVQNLFKPTKVSTYALQSKVVSKLRLIGKGIEKGISYHAYSVKEYPKKPPEIVQLEDVRYWTRPAPSRTQIRLGRDVYVEKSFLDSVQDLCGPSSPGKSINRYGYFLTMHLVGGEDTAQFCRQNKKIFPESLKSMLDLDTLIAVCLHAEETFHLAEALDPSSLCSDATGRLAEKRRGPRTDRREKFLANQAAKAAKKKEVDDLRKLKKV